MAEDRLIPRRHEGWARDIESTPPGPRTAYQRVLRDALAPNVSVLYRNMRGPPTEAAAAPPRFREISETAKLDAPGVADVPGERLCDWGAVNDDLIVWVGDINNGAGYSGCIFARNMHTRRLGRVAALATGGRVKAVRWNPGCTLVGMAMNAGVVCVDAAAGRPGWECASLGVTRTVEWRDNHVAASCTPTGVVVYDIRLARNAMAPLNMARASVTAWVDHGIAVAGGGTVVVYDIRKFAHGVQIVRSHDETVTALDWRSQLLAVGTSGGDVSVLRTAGMETLARAGDGLVGIMWGPRGRGIVTLTETTHLVAHNASVRAQAHCASRPLYMVRNGDRTRVVVVTANEVAAAFEVYPPQPAERSREPERRGLIR